MRTITAISAPRRGGRRKVNVFLDDAFAFSLGAEVVAKRGLQAGQTLSPPEVSALQRAEALRCCRESAWHLLRVRPRSQQELRDRLRRHGYEENAIEAVLGPLRQQGLVDDFAFARFWVENRESFNPRGSRLLAAELRQKGLAPDVIAPALAAVDEEAAAYRAGQRKLRSLQGLDYAAFRRRLAEMLRRRGFSYATIARTVDRMWSEADIT